MERCFFARFKYIVLLNFLSISTVQGRSIDSNWYLDNAGVGSLKYKWQSDPNYSDALNYLISNQIYDLKHYIDRPSSCAFDVNNPTKCILSTPVRCPKPKTLAGGGQDVVGKNSFMSYFEPYDYCSDAKEMYGDISVGFPAIFATQVFIDKFKNPLSQGTAFTLDSEITIPKVMRRQVLGYIKQQLNQVQKMACAGFNKKTNFATLNANNKIEPRVVEAPIGHYDCAQKVGGINVAGNPGFEGELFSGLSGVNYTLRDRGNANEGACVKEDTIYFDDNNCLGHAFVRLGKHEELQRSFYRFRSLTSATNAVVDIESYPYFKDRPAFNFNPGAPVYGGGQHGSTALWEALSQIKPAQFPTKPNPLNEKIMYRLLLDEFKTGTPAQKKIVTAYFTEILDKTVYYDTHNPARPYRRTVRFKNNGAVPPSVNHIEEFLIGSGAAIKSYLDSSGVCQNAAAAQYEAAPGVPYYFGYLDPIPGKIQDYSGLITRPYREIDPTLDPILQKDLYESLYAKTIESRVYFDEAPNNLIVDIGGGPGGGGPGGGGPGGGGPGGGGPGGGGPGGGGPGGGGPGGGGPGGGGVNLSDVESFLESSYPVARFKISQIGGGTATTSFAMKRDWWTEDSGADKSGILRPLICEPDEQMIAMGRNINTFSNSSDWTKNYNDAPYCLRYPVTAKNRRDPGTGLLGIGIYGNPLPDFEEVENGMLGSSMVCDEDEYVFKKPATYKHEGNLYVIGSADATYFKNALNAYNNNQSLIMSAKLSFERKFNSLDGLMTIPARAIALGDPGAKMETQVGLCVRMKKGINHPKYPLGPLVLPLRIYINDILTTNFYMQNKTKPPVCF